MDRKIALEEIKQKFEAEKSSLHQKFREKLAQREEELIMELYGGIRQLDVQYPIRILQFQMMRADIYQGHSDITLCGYNADWYLDEERTEYRIEADYLYEPFEEVEERMRKEISVYMGAISAYDIKNIICEYFLECFAGMADKMQEKFYLFDEWAKENQISFTTPYRLVWGEYMGDVKTIFYMDRCEKTTQEVQQELEDNKEKEAYLFGSWVAANLADITVEQRNFAHLNLKTSQMSLSTFRTCIFARAMFWNSCMEWCSFEQSVFNGCNFNEIQAYQLDMRGAEIANCAFERSHIRKGKFDEAVITDAIFTDGSLEECSFRNATLCRVDLRTKCLSNIDFTGTKFQDVYIYAENADEINLTEEQMEQVYIPDFAAPVSAPGLGGRVRNG